MRALRKMPCVAMIRYGNIVQPPSAVFPPKPSMHQAKLVTTVLQAKNLPRFDRTSEYYTKSDPEMAAALAWKRSLLYGKSHGKPLQSEEEVLVSSNSSAADSAPVSVSCSPVRRGPPTPPKSKGVRNYN